MQPGWLPACGGHSQPADPQCSLLLSLLLQALEAAEAVHSQLEALLERERSDNRGMAADAAEMQVGGSADVAVKSAVVARSMFPALLQ